MQQKLLVAGPLVEELAGVGSVDDRAPLLELGALDRRLREQMDLHRLEHSVHGHGRMAPARDGW